MKNLLRPFLVVLAISCCLMATAAPAGARARCCKPSCCVPPPPVEVTLQLIDPCTCCPVEACLCIPACCADEAPCITWRNGLFGRRVADVSWKCCKHKAKIIVNKCGEVTVR